MTDILNSTLLVPGYFCVASNVLELCSEAQLSCLQTVWSFGFFRQDWNKAQFRDSYSVLWRQDAAHDPAENTLSSVLSLRRLSRWWLMGTGPTRACVSTCSLILLGGPLLALVVSLDPGVDQFIAEYLREALWGLASVKLTSPVSRLPGSYPLSPDF